MLFSLRQSSADRFASLYNLQEICYRGEQLLRWVSANIQVSAGAWGIAANLAQCCANDVEWY